MSASETTQPVAKRPAKAAAKRPAKPPADRPELGQSGELSPELSELDVPSVTSFARSAACGGATRTWVAPS